MKKFKSISIFLVPELSVLCLAVMCALPASAQEAAAQPGVLHNPAANQAVHFAISPPLREMAVEVAPFYGFHEARPVLRPKLQHLMEAARQGQGTVEDGALQSSGGPLVSATVGLNLLGVGDGFPNYSVAVAPSDVNLAVGDTQVVQWVNLSYAVFDKTTGGIVAGPISGNAFWAPLVGSACATNNDGDIIAQWDKIAHRWVMAQNVFVPPYYTCVAISKTSDATGSYFLYEFPQPGFPDYPKWGVWPDAYYQAQNDYGPSGNSFIGVNACAYERSKMLVGDPSAMQICFLDNSAGTLFDDSMLPSDFDGTQLPPAGEPNVFLGSIDNGPATGETHLYKYLFHVDFTHPSNSTFTGVNGTMPIAVSKFGLACGGFGACIPRKGVADRLDSLGDRLMYRLAYRNFVTTHEGTETDQHQVWMVSHSVTAGTSSVGERWYEFHAKETGTTLTKYQSGTFHPDKNYRWMGSIAMDKMGDIALGYSASGSTLYPSIRFSGRVPSDLHGTMEAEATIVSGAGSQVGTSNRWGDYTSMAVDVQDDCTFWYANQWYKLTTSFDWSTELASIKFPTCH